MNYKLKGSIFRDGKVMKDSLIFYFIDSKIISCKWSNKVNPTIASDKNNLFYTQGLWIENDRSK